LDLVGVPRSSWYYKPVADEKKKQGRGGPKAKPIPKHIVETVVSTAMACPWYGYKKIAVIIRRNGLEVSNRIVYRVMKKHDLLKKRSRSREAALYQASKLYELLPTAPNELWQMDVTYVHIPGYGWWYAVTVIDYYSRYLLAAYLTHSYSAVEVIEGLKKAREEAERIHGPLKKQPFLVTDNGSSFIAKRFGKFTEKKFSHVRIQYRTPTQLGLLERFHNTLKEEEVYWRMYDSPAHARECLAEFHCRYNNERPHWALVPEEGGDPITPVEVYRDGRRTSLPRWQAWAREIKKKIEKELQSDAA